MQIQASLLELALPPGSFLTRRHNQLDESGILRLGTKRFAIRLVPHGFTLPATNPLVPARRARCSCRVWKASH